MTDIIRRPDLEAQEVSYPDYIGTKVYPWFGKPAIAGKLYYQDFKSDVTAQYNRNHASLADISDNIIAANDVNYACVETRCRVSMGYAQRMGYFDDEHADLASGRLAKRAYFNKIEALCAASLLNTTGAIDGTADPVGTIDTNVSLLRDAGIGRIGLVIANKNKVALKSNAIIADRMKATGVPTGVLSDVRNVQDIQLAACLGVDEILTGKDAIWYSGVAGDSKNSCALVVLPDEYEDPAESVQLGRVVYFMFTDSTDDRFVMESWVDAQHDANVVDIKGLVQVIELNAELRKTIKLFNGDDSSSN